jgi:hypothetical protein
VPSSKCGDTFHVGVGDELDACAVEVRAGAKVNTGSKPRTCTHAVVELKIREVIRTGGDLRRTANGEWREYVLVKKFGFDPANAAVLSVPFYPDGPLCRFQCVVGIAVRLERERARIHATENSAAVGEEEIVAGDVRRGEIAARQEAELWPGSLFRPV